MPDTANNQNQLQHDNRIDYIEFSVTDIDTAKNFYSSVFGWQFTDYGPGYTSFEDGRLSGGFEQVDTHPGPSGVLVVIYSIDLEATELAVRNASGTIVKETFEFPGGRRFQFTDPSGNELAVWSDR